MAANAFRIASAIASFLILAVYVHGQTGYNTIPAEPISQACLGCICEAASGCNVTGGCSGDVCGPFRITWGYWADSGKPTLNNEPSTNDGVYARCVNDPMCAARAVQGYMARYGQDCNGDRAINCDDYIRIHRLGGYGCTGALDNRYEDTYQRCMQAYG